MSVLNFTAPWHTPEEPHAPAKVPPWLMPPAPPAVEIQSHEVADTPKPEPFTACQVSDLQPDLSQADRFLTLLDETADFFTFQTFTDVGKDEVKPNPDPLADVRHGTMAQQSGWLTAMNRQRAGIFVTVNATNGHGRKREHIVRIRAVWQEDDQGCAPHLPIEPHIEVESSPGKFHRYVLVDEMPLDLFESVQQRLVDDYGSDPNAKDRSRVLRLPGFYHHKHREHPHLVQITQESGASPFAWTHLRDRLPPVERHAPAAKDTQAAVTITHGTVRDLRSALNSINPDDYQTWVNMGHALVELGNVGRELWLSWSQQSEKWRPQDAGKWGTFAGERTGYQAVFAEAQRHGWVNPMKGAKRQKVNIGEGLGGNSFTSEKRSHPSPGPGEKNSSGTEWSDTHVNHVNHVHLAEDEEGAGEELADDILLVEEAIGRCQEDPGVLAGRDFLDALARVRANSPEDWTRLRVRLKKEKPSGVLLGDIDEATRPASESNGESSIADALVELVRDKTELFHAKDGACFASVTSGAARKTFRLDTRAFREWLSYLYFTETAEQSGSGKAASDQAIRNAITTLVGLATHDGPERPAYLRVAQLAGAYYLDLGNDDWTVVEVTANGWRIRGDSPAKFWRSSSLEALPTPLPGGDLHRLWRYANIPEEHRLLVLAWMLETLRPETPFPVLELVGSHGSAKSSTQAKLRRVLDPNAVDLRAAPKSVEDLFVSAGCNWMASLNNLSHLSGNMQDALCNLATGGGFAARTLFTNGDETLIESKRPVIINGIVPTVTAQDLSDRVIHVELPPVATYRPESEIEVEYAQDAPDILGGLLDLFARTLACLPQVQINQPPRMADFARLGEAMTLALGGRPGDFLDLYNDNRRQSTTRGMEASPVATAVRELVEKEVMPNGFVFDGTMKHLLEKLGHYKEGVEAWPKSPRGLGDALRRQLPALSQIGIRVSIAKPGKQGVMVRIHGEG